MEPEAVLNLFDSFWFHIGIFKKQSKTSTLSTPEPSPGPEIQENSTKPMVSRQLAIHARSKSEQLVYPKTSLNTDISPDSVLLKPHLQTINSEREIALEIPKTPEFKKPSKGFINRKKKRLSKSLSELEFEELKGFMDLGFVFSEEDRDSGLVEIIPGLQRLGQKTDGHEEILSGPRERPYLSEAWEDLNKEVSPLLEWSFPAVSNEIDMKDSLKWWAHTVASAVR